MHHSRSTFLTCVGMAALMLGASAVQAGNTFVSTTAMREVRQNHTATLLPNGKVLIAGGSDSSGPVASAEIYDPATATWTNTGSMSISRASATATLLANGKVLIAGGISNETFGSTTFTFALNSAELYDPAKGTWKSVSGMHKDRATATATLLPGGNVLVTGGIDNFYDEPNSAEIYSPDTDTWTTTSPMVYGRLNHSATLLSNGKVLVTGGHSAFAYNMYLTIAFAEVYDPVSNTWTTTGAMRTSRALHTSILLPSGKVLVTGGFRLGQFFNLFTTTAAAELYDPVKGTWTATSPMKSVRFGHTTTLLPTGVIFACGGSNGSLRSGPPATAEFYDPLRGTWTLTGPMPSGHLNHTATLLPTGKVLVAGGVSTSSAVQAQAELYSPGQVSGSFNGLIKTTSGVPLLSTEGFFTATVSFTGAFTGRLTLDGTTLSLTGSFDDTAGIAHFGTSQTTSLNLALEGKPGLILTLQRDLSPLGTDNTITGTITRMYRSTITSVSSIHANRSYFDGLSPDTTVPAAYLGSANANGLFNVILPARPPVDQPAGLTTSEYPQGTGFGTLTITKAGAATFAAKLADGTAVTASAPLARHSIAPLITWPLFAQLYSKLGFISATVLLDNTNPDSDLSAGTSSLQWSRPFQSVQHYPYGWPEVIATYLLGSKFTITPGHSILPGITPPTPGNGGNAYLDLSQGLLASAFNRGLNLSSADVVTKLNVKDTGYTLALPHTTGKFTGTFLHADGTKPAYQGIVYQKGANAGGHGFFLTTTPRVKNYLGQSGVVKLTAQ